MIVRYLAIVVSGALGSVLIGKAIEIVVYHP